MQPVIRRYEAADLDAVMSVFLRSVRGVASRDYDAGQIARGRKWTAMSGRVAGLTGLPGSR